eukprot:TRINITY_DN19629_c0_g1_i1.p1 TRINITY_DN19629_c0_g1~~TRINITY_DN19629_c0_g1_i1.p1  ORF type:complete len:806 (+),score=117.02 TRINITY_DN19629_c0_g1_i1:179-2596(+)
MAIPVSDASASLLCQLQKNSGRGADILPARCWRRWAALAAASSTLPCAATVGASSSSQTAPSTPQPSSAQHPSSERVFLSPGARSLQQALGALPTSTTTTSTTQLGALVPVTTEETEEVSTTSELSEEDLCAAATDPCDCAAVNGCAWAHSAGGGVCFYVGAGIEQDGLVECWLCPTQDFCPDSACGQISEPCTCAESPIDCAWDAATTSCIGRAAGQPGTACSACPSQAGCALTHPEVVNFVPERGGIHQEGPLKVYLEFDMNMVLCSNPASQTIAEVWCDDTVDTVIVPSTKLSFIGKIFEVDATEALQTFARKKLRTCGLVVQPGTLCDVQNEVPFTGISRGGYSFSLQDEGAPHIVRFDPANNAKAVDLDGKLRIEFNEAVVLGPATLKATLNRLDEDMSGTFISETSSFALQAPGVSVEDRSLVVSLTGKLRASRLYSLSLPKGAVKDMWENEFQGLASEVYVFRADNPGIRIARESNDNSVIITIILVTGGALLVFLAAVVAVRMLYVHYAQWTELTELSKPPKPVSVPPQSNVAKTQVRVSQMHPTVSGDFMEYTTSSTSSHPLGDSLRRGSKGMGFGGPGGGCSPGGGGSWAHTPYAQPTPSGSSYNRVHPAEASSATQGVAFGHTQSQQPSQPQTQSAGPGAGGTFRAQSNGGPDPKPVGAAAAAHAAAKAAAKAAAQRPGARASMGPNPGQGQRSSAGSGPGSRPQGQQPGSAPPGQERQDSKPAAAASQEDSMSPEVRAVHRKLQAAMDESQAVRKKMIKDLMLEYHPDKNSDSKAKEIFQHINNAKSWFLHDA